MSSPRSQSSRRAADAGVTLFFALFVLLLLSGIAASMVFRTIAENRMSASYQNVSQGYYSALAGLEEGRGRLMRSAPDALPDSSLPQGHLDKGHAHVAYIVNSSPPEVVNPDDPASPYFDREYRREFPTGEKRTTVHCSDQPNALTPFAIPYKWVRITQKTEYSSQQDVNRDGVLDPNQPLVYDSSQQRLASQAPAGWVVYKVTALAVQPNGTRRLLQYEVASQSWIRPSAAVTAAGKVKLTGKLTVSGLDNCGAAPDLYGIVSGNTVTLVAGAAAIGLPEPYRPNSALSSPAASELLGQMAPFAIPIQEADPVNFSYDEVSQTYRGSWVVLGDLTSFPPTKENPAAPAIVYSDHSLSITAGKGAGILLVEGDLQIEGRFQYYGVIVTTGRVDIVADGGRPVQVYGAILPGGQLRAVSEGEQALDVRYDSCALSLAADYLPKAILAFKELQP